MDIGHPLCLTPQDGPKQRGAAQNAKRLSLLLAVHFQPGVLWNYWPVIGAVSLTTIHDRSEPRRVRKRWKRNGRASEQIKSRRHCWRCGSMFCLIQARHITTVAITGIVLYREIIRSSSIPPTMPDSVKCCSKKVDDGWWTSYITLHDEQCTLQVWAVFFPNDNDKHRYAPRGKRLQQLLQDAETPGRWAEICIFGRTASKWF